MSKKPRRPRDINQRAKLIVDVATGEEALQEHKPTGKNPAALATAYWKEIVAYFEAMPEYQRPPSYKKYAAVRKIIALSQNEQRPATTSSLSVTVPPTYCYSIAEPCSLRDCPKNRN